MYLKWFGDSLGNIWFHKAGLVDFVESCLTEGIFCQDLYFMDGDDRLHVSLVLESDSLQAEKASVSRKVTGKLASMGVDSVVSWKYWVDEKGQEVLPLVQRPLFWGAAGAVLAAVSTLGFKDTLICLLTGAVCFAVSYFILSELGREMWVQLRNFIKERLS